MGRDPGAIYRELAHELGDPVSDRVETAASAEERTVLQGLSPQQVTQTELAGEPIQTILADASGNNTLAGQRRTPLPRLPRSPCWIRWPRSSRGPVYG
jgi:phosphoglucomutase